MATEHEIEVIRNSLISISYSLLGIPYATDPDTEDSKIIGKWIDFAKLPVNLDCSGLTNGVYSKAGLHLVHGSQNQFNSLVETTNPQLGDLAFFGRDKDPKRIYHVGMLYHPNFMIESREYDGVRDWTGCVCIRGRKFWEAFPNFIGWKQYKEFMI